MEGNIFNIPWPWARLSLSKEEEMSLAEIMYQKSKRKIEALTQALTTIEKAFEEYKKASAKDIEHDLYVKGIRDKKKARRLRNKAKGPRK